MRALALRWRPQHHPCRVSEERHQVPQERLILTPINPWFIIIRCTIKDTSQKPFGSSKLPHLIHHTRTHDHTICNTSPTRTHADTIGITYRAQNDCIPGLATDRLHWPFSTSPSTTIPFDPSRQDTVPLQAPVTFLVTQQYRSTCTAIFLQDAQRPVRSVIPPIPSSPVAPRTRFNRIAALVSTRHSIIAVHAQTHQAAS